MNPASPMDRSTNPATARRIFACVVGGRKRVWHTERLWRLAEGLPAEPVLLASIAAIDQVTWFGEVEPTCRRVTEHARRIYEANLDHPIILSAEGWVMDGMHRICKALLLGHESIQAIRFSPTPEPDETH